MKEFFILIFYRSFSRCPLYFVLGLNETLTDSVLAEDFFLGV